MTLNELTRDTVWIKEYPVRYAGCSLQARMTIVRLSNGNLFIHSPCQIDVQTQAKIEDLGRVEFIVAPGTYHYFHVASAQAAFPRAETLICPGVEEKLPELEFDWLIGDRPDPRLEKDFEQVLVRGNRFMWEVVFFHKSTKTLIVTDLIENITDETPGINLILKFWWKVVFHMWNHPKPAPEYQMGWKDKAAARKSFEKIMDWDFERIILAHGDLIVSGARERALRAWEVPLRFIPEK